MAIVTVKGSLLRRSALILFVLFFGFSVAAVITIPGQAFIRILAGERPLDLAIIYPLFVFVFVGLAVIILLRTLEMWDEAVFSENKFRTHGAVCDYSQILRVHTDPSEEYMVMLLREPIGATNIPGIVMPKKSIRPSIQVLLDLLGEKK